MASLRRHVISCCISGAILSRYGLCVEKNFYKLRIYIQQLDDIDVMSTGVEESTINNCSSGFVTLTRLHVKVSVLVFRLI